MTPVFLHVAAILMLAARWKLVSASQRLSHGRVEFMQVIKTFDDILKVVELAGASS